MADIFISYSRHDSTEALSLAERLRNAGMEVWIDQHGIEAATSWSNEIVQALDDCKAVLVLLSSSSITSDNVVRELSLAFESKKTILPIDLESVLLPTQFRYPLAGIQRAQISDFDAILRSLKKLGIESTHSSETTNQITEIGSMIVRLAVLPFEDLSPGKDHSWFSDGLTYELIDRLMGLQHLFVIDRQTVHEYKESRLRAKQIADELHVRYIVTGGVQKAGENIRITATLIDSENGKSIWSFRQSGTMNDIFAIQERVAKEITEGLRLTLSVSEEQWIEQNPTDNSAAYELYLQAMYYDNRNTKQDTLHAISLGEEAVRLDPDFALALRCLGITYLGYYRNYDRSQKWLTLAEEVILRSQKLKPNHSHIHSTLGILYMYQKEPERAIESSNKAVELSPNLWQVYFHLGYVYMELGKFKEGAEAYEQALIRNPESVQAHFNAAIMYDNIGDNDRKIAAAQRGLPYIKKFLFRHPDDQSSLMNYAIMLFFVGEKEQSIREIDRLLGLPNVDPNTYYNMGCIITALGESERAMKLFEQSVESGFRNLDKIRDLTDNDEIKNVPALHGRYLRLVQRLDTLIAKDEKTNIV